MLVAAGFVNPQQRGEVPDWSSGSLRLLESGKWETTSPVPKIRREKATLAVGTGRVAVAGGHESLGAREAVDDDSPSQGASRSSAMAASRRDESVVMAPANAVTAGLATVLLRHPVYEFQTGVIECAGDCRVVRGIGGGRRRRNSPHNASHHARRNSSAAEQLAARSSLPAVTSFAAGFALTCANASALTDAKSGRARSIGRNCVSEPPVGRQPISSALTTPSRFVSPARQSSAEPDVGTPISLPAPLTAAPPELPPDCHGIGIDPGRAVDTLLEQRSTE